MYINIHVVCHEGHEGTTYASGELCLWWRTMLKPKLYDYTCRRRWRCRYSRLISPVLTLFSFVFLYRDTACIWTLLKLTIDAAERLQSPTAVGVSIQCELTVCAVFCWWLAELCATPGSQAPHPIQKHRSDSPYSEQVLDLSFLHWEIRHGVRAWWRGWVNHRCFSGTLDGRKGRETLVVKIWKRLYT